MLTDQDFRDFVEDITNGTLRLRAGSLRALWQMPSRDPRLLPYLEHLLYDKTPCILGFPLIFGEVRWLAAQALAAERTALGIREPVRVQNVVHPIYTSGITQAEEAAGIEFKGGVEGVLENLAILRDLGYLPMYDLELPRKREPSFKPTSPKPIIQQSPLKLALVPS